MPDMKLVFALVLGFCSIADVVDAAAKVNGVFCPHNIYQKAGVQCFPKKKGSLIQWPSYTMINALLLVEWKPGGAHKCAGPARRKVKRQPEAASDVAGVTPAPHTGLALSARAISRGDPGPNVHAAPGEYTASTTVSDITTAGSKVAKIWGTVDVSQNADGSTSAALGVCGFDIDLNKYGLTKCECYYET